MMLIFSHHCTKTKRTYSLFLWALWRLVTDRASWGNSWILNFWQNLVDRLVFIFKILNFRVDLTVELINGLMIDVLKEEFLIFIFFILIHKITRAILGLLTIFTIVTHRSVFIVFRGSRVGFIGWLVLSRLIYRTHWGNSFNYFTKIFTTRSFSAVSPRLLCLIIIIYHILNGFLNLRLKLNLLPLECFYLLFFIFYFPALNFHNFYGLKITNLDFFLLFHNFWLLNLSWFFLNVIKNPFPLGFFGFSLSFMYLRHFNSWLTVGSRPSTIILY